MTKCLETEKCELYYDSRCGLREKKQVKGKLHLVDGIMVPTFESWWKFFDPCIFDHFEL